MKGDWVVWMCVYVFRGNRDDACYLAATFL